MNSTFQALGWTLIHFCWQAAVIAALYLIVDLGLKNTTSRTRYLLALATLSSMFFIFAATLGYETWHHPAASLLSFNTAATAPLVTAPANTFPSKIGSLANGSIHLHSTALLPWLDGIWVLGVAGLSLRSLGGWLWLQRLRRATTEEAPAAIQASFRKVCVKLGIKRLPQLRISRIVPGPLTIGVLRTLVLLPASALLALSPEQLEAVFAHELAHVRRADYFWNLVQTLAETLFFFHPAVWWLGRRLREQRELCCDDIAITTCSDPVLYATALFRLEDQRAAGLNLAMALDGHQSRATFHSRILRILGEAAPQSPSVGLRPLSFIAVGASLFLFLSPLPKMGAIVAQRLPVKQMLAMPAEIASATKNLSLRLTHNTPAPRKPAEVQEAKHSPTPSPVTSPAPESAAQPLEYEKQMRATGYDFEQGQYEVLQHAGITPAYAEEMSNLGLGRPSAGVLLELKTQNVTGQYVATMRAAGLEPRGFEKLISYRIFDITPEFIAGMKAAGFDSIPPGKLRVLRSVGVTPEYAKAMKQQFPNASVQDLIEFRVLQSGNDVASFPQAPNLSPPSALLDSATPQPPPHLLRSSTSGQPPQSEPSGQPPQSDSPPPLIQ